MNEAHAKFDWNKMEKIGVKLAFHQNYYFIFLNECFFFITQSPQSDSD